MSHCAIGVPRDDQDVYVAPIKPKWVLVVDCPVCLTRLDVRFGAEGRAVKCSFCSTRFIVGGCS